MSSLKRLVAWPDSRDGSVTIHQNASIYTSVLAGGETVTQARPNCQAWLQIVMGGLTLEGETPKAGDAAGINEEKNIALIGQANETEFLLFDLP